MTDEEILKAFQLCNTDTDCDTNGCPYNDMVEDCISMLNNDIISRFNELKAENAELRERLDKAQKRVAVLERAIKIYQTQYGDVRFFNFDVAIRQAEKEMKWKE